MIRLKQGARIAAEGDSLTYGMDVDNLGVGAPINGHGCSRCDHPYPETLEIELANQVAVENRGFPGDRTIDGLVRWQWASPSDLTILMYGVNDCAQSLTPHSFARALKPLIERRHESGCLVVVLPPPPLLHQVSHERVEPFRLAARKISGVTGSYCCEVADAVLSTEQAFYPDGVHLTSAAYVAIARCVARVVDVLPLP